MSDLRENLGWLIGSIATAIAMAVGWIYESGILNTLVGIIVGAGIAYFVQTKTQNRAWKREYSVKIVETVYSSLFKAATRIIPSLEKKYYRQISFGEWETMQEDHRHLMVDEKFRTKLDDFSERVQNYSNAVYELRNENLPKIANEETERVFNVEAIGHATLEVTAPSLLEKPNIIRCLISETHPKDEALRNTPESSNVRFDIRIQMTKGTFTHSNDLSKFNEFWESCLKRMREDKTYRFIIEENDKLLEEARKVKKELVKRIEKPWKI